MMGHREIEKSEMLWFHLSEVKHLNQQHFYVFEAWGLHFLMIPLQKKMQQNSSEKQMDNQRD